MSIVYPSTVLLISPIVFVFLITNDNVSNKYFESNEQLGRVQCEVYGRYVLGRKILGLGLGLDESRVRAGPKRS